MKKDNSVLLWVLVIGILVILGLAALGVVFSFRQSMQQAQAAIQPVGDLTRNVATQVAQFLNPTPTVLPDPVSIIHEARALSRLETIQYSVEKVISAETGQGAFGFLFGDRLLFVAHGTVIAGIDLEKLTPDDLQVRDGVLYVNLPDSEIFVATLDNEKSYIYDRDTGMLTHGDINLESAARLSAEQEIEKTALEDGILDQARVNAESYLYRFFRNLKFPEVIFIQSAPTPVPDD
jgi:hypothetical protein